MEKWNEKIDRIFYFIIIILCVIIFMTTIYIGFQGLEKHLQDINYVEIMNGGF